MLTEVQPLLPGDPLSFEISHLDVAIPLRDTELTVSTDCGFYSCVVHIAWRITQKNRKYRSRQKRFDVQVKYTFRGYWWLNRK